MSTRLRTRIAALLLAFVVVWPPAQHVLSRSFDMDPWAFFGFAMYAAPNLRTHVRAGILDGAQDAEPDWNAVPRDVADAIHAYALRRARWGELLPPDGLAAEIFERHPELPGLVVRVRRWVLERGTARIAHRDRDYTFAPPGR